MPSRTGYAGTQSVGDVLTSANFTKLPNGLIAYSTQTTNSATFTNTAVDLYGGWTVTFTAGTSRIYLLQVDCIVSSTVANDVVRLLITDNANAQLTFRDVKCITASDNYSGFASLLVTPASGSITYKVRAARQSGSGNCNIGASATAPSDFRAFDQGPAF